MSMTEIRHGGFAIDIPEGWSDQSTLLFIAPLEARSSIGARPVCEMSEAVSVKFSLEVPARPQDLLEAAAVELRAIDPAFEVLDAGPFECGLGDGWQYTQRLTLEGIVVCQISVACIVGSVAVMATAASPEARFAKTRANLAAILGSMKAA